MMGREQLNEEEETIINRFLVRALYITIVWFDRIFSTHQGNGLIKEKLLLPIVFSSISMQNHIERECHTQGIGKDWMHHRAERKMFEASRRISCLSLSLYPSFCLLRWWAAFDIQDYLINVSWLNHCHHRHHHHHLLLLRKNRVLSLFSSLLSTSSSIIVLDLSFVHQY